MIYTASTPRATWPPPDSTTTSTWGPLSPASGARTARSCWIWKIPSASTLNGWTRRRGRSRLGKASAAVGVGVLNDPGAVRLPHGCGGMRACRPTHYFSTGCRAGCPHPAGTLPLQPIYGQSQYTRPHPPSGGGSGTFSLRAKSRLSGGCAPTRACGRSPKGEGSILYYIFKQVIQ